MDSRLETIRKKLDALNAKKRARAAEIAAMKEAEAKASAEAAAKIEAQRAASQNREEISQEDYFHAVNDCDDIVREARDRLIELADTVLKTFYEAREEYETTCEAVTDILDELDAAAGHSFEATDPMLRPAHKITERPAFDKAGRWQMHYHRTPLEYYTGDPSAPGYKVERFRLWSAVNVLKPARAIPEHVHHKSIDETPTFRSYEEAEEAAKRYGLRRYAVITEGPKVETPETWLDPSIQWTGSSVTKIETRPGEVPARMDYEGHIQEGGVLGRDGRVIIPPDKD